MASDGIEYRIQELNLDMIAPSPSNYKNGGSKIVVIGKPGTGKSFLLQDLLYNKRYQFPCGMVCSGTEDSNGFYSKIFPPTFVYPKYDEERVKSFITRQKLAKEHLKNPWAVLLLDDCTDDPALFKKPLMQGLFKNGRHYSMLFILSLQYCLDVKPAIRTSIDGTFILRESNLKSRQTLWENYAGVIPDFKTFCDMMDQLTEDYTAIYIHNRSQSNKLEDCVFYYKARPIPDGFRFGCQEYWEHSMSRYNTEFREHY